MPDKKLSSNIDPMPRKDHKVLPHKFNAVHGSGSIPSRDSKPSESDKDERASDIRHLNLGSALRLN